MTTKTPRTSDEYSFVIQGLLAQAGIELYQIKDVIVSSVVPNIMHSLNNGFMKLFGKYPMQVGQGTDSGIQICTDNPSEVGADRIVDAAGAYYLYGGPVMVIDFGTATTYDLVSEDGCFEAAITSPGLRICAKALWQDTAKLPEIEIKKPESILGKDTVTSMQAGLVYGYIGQTEYIIDRVKQEAGIENLRVVATGGVAKIIAKETDRIDVLDPNLTLKGLRLIYERTIGMEQNQI
jgi:type III pantothenate kinase